MDGNFFCRLVPGTLVVDMHTHGKFRGADFDALSFQLISGTSDKLRDENGDLDPPTIFAKALTEGRAPRSD